MMTTTRQLLIVLSFLSILLSAMIIASGAAALGMDPIPNSRRVKSQFHERLGSRVGTVYEADMHRELTNLIVSHERTSDAALKVFDAFGRVATTVGILAVFSSLISLLLVLRSPPLKAQAEQNGTSNGG